MPLVGRAKRPAFLGLIPWFSSLPDDAARPFWRGGPSLDDDAGFAAAVTYRQQLLHNKLTAAYANGAFPTTLAADLPGGPPDVSVSFFLAEPDIACEGTTNLLVVTVPVWGEVTVTESTPATVQIKGLIDLTIVPNFQLLTETDPNTGMVTRFVALNQLTTIAIRTWTASVVSADPPADVAAYATGDMLRTRLQTAITDAVETGMISLPQIPVDYLGGIPAFVGADAVQSVVVDGALVLGFPVGDDSPTGPLPGDPAALADFAGSFDLAAAINPVAVRLFFNDVQDDLASSAASAGGTIDVGALKITPEVGFAYVTGKINATGGTLNFSFDVMPHMANYTGPGAAWEAYTLEHWIDKPRLRTVKPRSWPALWFTTANAQSDVDASWWVSLLEALIFETAFYFLPTFSADERSFDNQINDHPPGAPNPRVQHAPAPAGGIVVRTALDDFELTTDGISLGVHVSAKPTELAIIGPAIVPSSYAAQSLRYMLRLPSGVFPSDPTLRVAWTLTDTTSGAVLANQDDPVTDASPGFEFQPDSFASSSTFDIQGRIYRLFGAEVDDVGSATTSMQLRGALAPRAYVRWRAQSVKPDVIFDATVGQWKYSGDVHVKRLSKWHRTDAPCLAASKGANYAGRYQAQYADNLPFPLDKLAQFRPILCDYCFFGGPTGTNAKF
jgi:hypothetical protein